MNERILASIFEKTLTLDNPQRQGAGGDGAAKSLARIERDMAGEPQSIQRVIQPVGVDARIAALLRGMGEGVEDADFEEVEKGADNGLGREKTGGADRGREGVAEDREDGNGGSGTGAGEVAGEGGEDVADGGGTPSV